MGLAVTNTSGFPGLLPSISSSCPDRLNLVDLAAQQLRSNSSLAPAEVAYAAARVAAARSYLPRVPATSQLWALLDQLAPPPPAKRRRARLT
jgi:hypothetical protein